LRREVLMVAAALTLAVLFVPSVGVIQGGSTQSKNESGQLSAIQVRALVTAIQENPVFIAAESGVSYQYVSSAGLATTYHNGTQTIESVLYFDHYSSEPASGGLQVILSQLQVYVDANGTITSIYPINDSTLLNYNFG
jgi:hypothetical protein